MSRQSSSFLAGLLVLAVAISTTAGEVPTLLNYQGRISVENVNFTGTGYFKFALVDGGTEASVQATASATVNSGFLTGITVTDAGAGYTAVPAVTIADSTGSDAAVFVTISGGSVDSITVTDAGIGYSDTPTVTIDPPPSSTFFQTFWSNDGTSGVGSEPQDSVPVNVAKGLYSVFLGDTTLPNMSVLTPDLFRNLDLRLRVWFDDGTDGFQMLSPDQQVTSAAYAFSPRKRSPLTSPLTLTMLQKLPTPPTQIMPLNQTTLRLRMLWWNFLHDLQYY